MKDFFRKLFTPWRAEDCFDDHEAYCRFLVQKDKRLNGVRVVLFVAAAILLMLGYALSDEVRNVWYYSAAGCLAVALAVTLVVGANEKQLPKELQQK